MDMVFWTSEALLFICFLILIFIMAAPMFIGTHEMKEGTVIGKEYEEPHSEVKLVMMGRTMIPMSNSVEGKYKLKIKCENGKIETHEVSAKQFEEAEIFKHINLNE